MNGLWVCGGPHSAALLVNKTIEMKINFIAHYRIMNEVIFYARQFMERNCISKTGFRITNFSVHVVWKQVKHVFLKPLQWPSRHRKLNWIKMKIGLKFPGLHQHCPVRVEYFWKFELNVDFQLVEDVTPGYDVMMIVVWGFLNIRMLMLVSLIQENRSMISGIKFKLWHAIYC